MLEHKDVFYIEFYFLHSIIKFWVFGDLKTPRKSEMFRGKKKKLSKVFKRKSPIPTHFFFPENFWFTAEFIYCVTTVSQ